MVLTSRTWELVRAGGSRLDIRDRLVRRNGRDAVVIYRWEIAPQWEQEHHIEIAVAQVGSGRVGPCPLGTAVVLALPIRRTRVGVAQRRTRVEKSTFDPEAEGYMVVATKE